MRLEINLQAGKAVEVILEELCYVMHLCVVKAISISNPVKNTAIQQSRKSRNPKP